MKTEIKSVDVQTAKRLFDSGAHMVDVRSASEWGAGHVDGSDQVPPGKVGVHTVGRADSVITVCANGSKSMKAAKKLAKAGYNVYYLEGGLEAWNQAGFPLTSTNGNRPEIV